MLVVILEGFIFTKGCPMNINKNVLTLNKAGLSTGDSTSYKKMRLLYLPVLLVVLLAGWGISLAYSTLNQKPSLIFGINQPVATSFGSIVVSEADDLIGLTSQDLAGVTHGIQNLVLIDKTQIQLTVALLNRSNRTIAYSPEQFTLAASHKQIFDQRWQIRSWWKNPNSIFQNKGNEVILISGATIHDGKLQPRSNIEATLSFVVPRDGSSYILQYLDPGNDQIVQIDLGGVDVVSDEELDKLHH